MNCHNRRWYQQTYLSPTWVCTICEFEPGVYRNPQALYSHLQESHLENYTNEQLRVISQQSKITQTRDRDNCLLCCFKVEEEDAKSTAMSLKRKSGIFQHNTFKSARKTYSMKYPSHFSSDDSDSSDTSSELDSNTLQQRLRRAEGRSKTITSHIAVHLQVLMLLTLRFAAARRGDDKTFLDDDLKSDCVEFDDENSSSKSNMPENLSNVERMSVVMEDTDDEDNSVVSNEMDDYVAEVNIPDTDLNFDDIPRQYDGLVDENDAFLKEVIESGAWQSWQSWQDETKEQIRLGLDDYAIAWICATHTEYTAARLFLDSVHLDPNHAFAKIDKPYTFGQIMRHNVIIIAASSNNENERPSVASVTRDMVIRFPNIKFYLLVGIGGGAPSTKHDIRLGDVIVGYLAPEREDNVFQYDFEEPMQIPRHNGFRFLDQPLPMLLRIAIERVRSQFEMKGHRLEETINAILDNNQQLRERYKRPETDRLYRSQFVHPANSENDCAVVCGDDPSGFVQRPERTKGNGTIVHYGVIASAYEPMKDALFRDGMAEIHDVLCFDTEAAGLMHDFSCVFIRGICDYSDSHHNEDWQGYAAMTAAAYAKQLLCKMRPRVVKTE
jgi:nucleoside phosphorylase